MNKVLVETLPNLNRILAASNPAMMQQMIGHKRLKRTAMEATIRMLADHFLVYDESVLSQKLGSEQNLPRTKEVPVRKHMRQYLEESASVPSPFRTLNQGTLARAMQEPPSPRLLAELSQQLRSEHSVPDLKDFLKLVQRLNMHGHGRAAQFVLDCMYQSEMALSPATYRSALRVAISTNDPARFGALLRFLDLDQSLATSDYSAMPISKHHSHTWVPLRISKALQEVYNEELKLRIFSTEPSQLLRQRFQYPFAAKLYHTVLEGLYSLGWLDRVDAVLAQLAQLEVRINADIVVTLLKIARKDKDPIRARYAWGQAQQLGKGCTDKVYMTAAVVGRALGDADLVQQALEAFEETHGPSVPLSYELNHQAN